METMISIEGLSKRYDLREGGGAGSLRDAVGSVLRGFRKAPKEEIPSTVRRASQKEFWALDDVNLDVRRGEVVGILGRNGAGKSTLLKVLSRITEPTSGRIRLRGRVASLLEVGTGFHGELTGRENIFLNGALLGMSRAEIMRKFDEIIAFAEVDRFLDTPVKRYSSGMYVRLAFAVAAHLEPEILIVDEVLAVGDAAFQKKCLGKMNEVAESEGRTILFVSHNMATVELLCTRAVLLQEGRVVADGAVHDIVTQYSRQFETLMYSTRHEEYYSKDHQIGIRGMRAETQSPPGGETDLVIRGEVFGEPLGPVNLTVEILSMDGVRVACHNAHLTGFTFRDLKEPRAVAIRCDGISGILAPGDYGIILSFMEPKGRTLLRPEPPLPFSLPAKDLYRRGQYLHVREHGPAALRFHLEDPLSLSSSRASLSMIKTDLKGEQ